MAAWIRLTSSSEPSNTPRPMPDVVEVRHDRLDSSGGAWSSTEGLAPGLGSGMLAAGAAQLGRGVLQRKIARRCEGRRPKMFEYHFLPIRVAQLNTLPTFDMLPIEDTQLLFLELSIILGRLQRFFTARPPSLGRYWRVRPGDPGSARRRLPA